VFGSTARPLHFECRMTFMRPSLRRSVAVALMAVSCSLGASNQPDASTDDASADAALDANDGEAAPGCSLDLTTDNHNCGSCGHDCLGGACTDGECQAYAIATDLLNPRSIAIDDTNVYLRASPTPTFDTWTTKGNTAPNGRLTIWRMRKDGSAPPDLLVTTNIISLDSVHGDIFVDATWIFFDYYGVVYRLPKDFVYDGGGMMPWLDICSDSDIGVSMAFDDNAMYFRSSITQGIYRFDRADWPTTSLAWCGGAPMHKLADFPTGDYGNAGLEFAQDATHVFFTHDGIPPQPEGAFQLDKYADDAGTDASLVYLGPSARDMIASGIVSDGQHVYWASPLTGSIFRAPIGGGQVDVFASGQNAPVGLAVDANALYWTNNNGDTVMSCPLAACTAPRVIASEQAGPFGIATDATAVYWTNVRGGTVMRVAK
jgi:hypothetical protein